MFKIIFSPVLPEDFMASFMIEILNAYGTTEQQNYLYFDLYFTESYFVVSNG